VKPDLDIEVIDWADAVHVVAVRIFGTDHNGDNVDRVVRPPGLCTIAEIRTIVAKMNNNHYRP
jgi:hypothetical protein